MGTTAKLGIATIIFQILCLVAIVGLAFFSPEADPEKLKLTSSAITAIAQLSIGGGIGGATATVGHGLRHFGTKAPTSLMMGEE